MKNRYLSATIVGAAFSMAYVSSCVAAVSTDEAKQLGGPVLTVWGAEKAGNKEGTIPPCCTPIKPPANYDPKEPGQRPDPFKEKPLFSITAANMAQYADKLTEGHKLAFKIYPNYRMDIYPTHRTVDFPQYVLDNTIKNATSCKALDGGNRVDGCYGGFPFPIPKTGNELMWNHLMGYEGSAYYGGYQSWLVTPTGAPVLQAQSFLTEQFPMYDPKNTKPNGPNDIFWKVLAEDVGPARRIGSKVILHDYLDQVKYGRRAWQYIPGQRRVKLAPDLSYDTPTPYGAGIATMDDGKGFIGALDRYDWKLVGKQEKYILYNTFALYNKHDCPSSKLVSTKNFPNPDCMRYELHRVWVVEATLKPGFRHIYKKRTMYWDEDSFVAGHVEAYDAAGKLFRMGTSFYLTFYEGKAATGTGSIYWDLSNGMYVSTGSGGFDNGGFYLVPPKNDYYFSPEAMAGEGVR